MKKYYKYLTILPLIAVLALYTQCVPSAGKKKTSLKYNDTSSSETSFNFTNNPIGNAESDTSQDGNSTGGTALTSVQAFSQTVHPITKKNCVLCHGSLQQPLHAAQDVNVAHDAVMQTAKVNLSNPSQSRLVLKLQSGHNCWGNCNSNANEMLDAINNWVDLMKSPDVAEPTEPVGLVTAESRPIAEVLDPNLAGDAGSFLINLESAMLQAPMVKATVSNQSYLWVPAGTHNNTQANTSSVAGRAYSQVSLTESARYKVFGYVSGASTNDDSFHIRLGANSFTEWHTAATSSFSWVEVTSGSARQAITYNLASGTNQIEIREREDGAKISQLFITNDLNKMASDISGGDVATLSYSLEALAPGSNATLKVDVTVYDNYSYKLSKPRIILPSGRLTVKSLKPLVNGSWNPQHSTYTLVNSVVTSSNSSLSGSSMIILKDGVEDVDKIAFEFEMIDFRP